MNAIHPLIDFFEEKEKEISPNILTSIFEKSTDLHSFLLSSRCIIEKYALESIEILDEYEEKFKLLKYFSGL